METKERTSTTTDTGPSIGCNQCTGTPGYRVQMTGMTAPEDNFDQLVDHTPILFMHTTYLRSLQLHRTGSITIWRLPAAQGGDLTSGRIIAYAGPDPLATARRTWFNPMQTASVELLATLTALVSR